MRGIKQISIVAALILAAGVGTTHASAQEGAGESPFYFRDGDRIVVVGDSITYGGYYARYIDNFIRTRFPTWKIAVRICGTNGQTAQGTFSVIDSDVLVWKPSVVVINYGMNDERRQNGLEFYREGITRYVEKLLAAKVRVVLCSNTPLDRGDEPGKYLSSNMTFHLMAQFAEQHARERGLRFVDQFHFCHTLWGENRKRPNPVPVSDQTLAKHLSDDVHPRLPGHTTMAYIILKTLKAPSEVSFASIDARNGASKTRRCQIRDFKVLEGGRGISFVRADEASPCWIEEHAASGLELVPFNEELNRMTLRITDFPPGIYDLKIDGQVHGRYAAGILADGINLSTNRKSPIYDPGRKVSDLVARQRNDTYEARDLTAFQPPSWLTIADLAQQKKAAFARLFAVLENRDAEIGVAAAPRPHRYEITIASPEKGK